MGAAARSQSNQWCVHFSRRNGTILTALSISPNMYMLTYLEYLDYALPYFQHLLGSDLAMEDYPTCCDSRSVQ